MLERKPVAEIEDQTMILADVAEKAMRQVENTVRDLLRERLPEEQAARLARTLAGGTWTHDYPITVSQARELSLPVSTEMPKEVFDLMQFYPQTGQQRPSVEYIPLPYGPRERQPERPSRLPKREA